MQAQVLGGTIQQQVDESRAKLDDKVAENKKIGVRIRNALKKEQDNLDDESIQASKEDGKEKLKHGRGTFVAASLNRGIAGKTILFFDISKPKYFTVSLANWHLRIDIFQL